MTKRIMAFWLGLKDGYSQPEDLTVGMSWGDSPEDPRNIAYDHGVNLGQWIGLWLGE